jgi:hypothetical protein
MPAPPAQHFVWNAMDLVYAWIAKLELISRVLELALHVRLLAILVSQLQQPASAVRLDII